MLAAIDALSLRSDCQHSCFFTMNSFSWVLEHQFRMRMVVSTNKHNGSSRPDKGCPHNLRESSLYFVGTGWLLLFICAVWGRFFVLRAMTQMRYTQQWSASHVQSTSKPAFDAKLSTFFRSGRDRLCCASLLRRGFTKRACAGTSTPATVSFVLSRLAIGQWILITVDSAV